MKSLFSCAVVLLLVAAMIGCNCPNPSNANTNSNSNSSSASGQYSTAEQALDAGINYLETGETEKAIAAFNEAVALDPTLADAYFQLGITYALIESQNAGIATTPTPPPITQASSETASGSTTTQSTPTPSGSTKTTSQI